MGKKILSVVLIVASFFWGTPAIAKKAAASGRQVKVILKDNSVVNGELLGQDGGTVSILNEDGKLQDIAAFKIKKVFDADGNVVVLKGETEAVKEKAPQAEEVKKPAPREAMPAAPRKSGMETAGKIMFWSGLGVCLVGAVVADSGTSQKSDALKKYLNNPGLATDGNYYGYPIDGKYYTASQYADYYAGQDTYDSGIGIVYIGAAVGLTGLIFFLIGNASGAQQKQASLMHLEDGQLAWSLPEVQLTPNMGGRMTLLNANF